MTIKDIIEYKSKYGDISRDQNIRLVEYMKSLNYKEKNIDELNTELLRISGIRKHKISFVFYFIPKPTPRPRISRFTKTFYVKDANKYSTVFKEFVESTEDINFKISTPTVFNVRSYFPIPTGMTKIEKVLCEIGIIPYVFTPDWDNIGKTYSDMVRESLLADDSLIYDGRSIKKYSCLPRIEIEMIFYDENPIKYISKRIESWKKK